MERRRAARRTLAPDEPIAHARLRTGCRLRVVDASSCGVLTETTERLLPGRHLDVHIVTRDGRVLVRSRVARAYVCVLHAESVCYRVALAFDRPVDTGVGGYSIPGDAAILPSFEGRTYSESPPGDDVVFDERLTV